MNDTELFIFTGLPGSGKTHVANTAAKMTDGRNLSSGDILRQLAVAQGLNDLSSDKLGEFAASMRQRNGHEFVAKKAVTMFETGDLELSDPMFIDGIRHADGVEVLRDTFGDTTLVWVAAPKHERLDRLRERARENEEDFTRDDIAARDERELERLGLKTMLQQRIVDYRLDNSHEHSNIHDQLAVLIHDSTAAGV